MDLKGSLVDANLRIYPSEKLINYIKTITNISNAPDDLLKLVGKKFPKAEKVKEVEKGSKSTSVHLNDKDNENLKKVRQFLKKNEVKDIDDKKTDAEVSDINEKLQDAKDLDEKGDKKTEPKKEEKSKEKGDGDSQKTKEPKYEYEEKEAKTNRPFLTTASISWLYTHLKQERSEGKQNVPYLHELILQSEIVTPENEIIKRNPVLEARCVKLRAQQEAREYRKMTKGVDNVRMRFPEDSISYQLKQMNRQLIAVGQFIISIFAGFLFGFRGVEWMVGTLDFGFRLLLGVMCALVIALAEIYFLAKKLNEELSVPETVQLGGPPKFVDEKNYTNYTSDNVVKKEHQD